MCNWCTCVWSCRTAVKNCSSGTVVVWPGPATVSSACVVRALALSRMIRVGISHYRVDVSLSKFYCSSC